MVSAQSPRPLMFDLAQGFLGRCPCCGKGRIFGAFLKVNDRCSVCGEELYHHRADDFPAYLVIFIVGHLVVPMALYVETQFAPSYWIHLALWLPLTIGLAMGLLQPISECRSDLRGCHSRLQLQHRADPRPDVSGHRS